MEILEKDRTLEEIQAFSEDVYEQSQPNTSFTSANNAFLTSLFVGASLVSANEVSARPVKLSHSNRNEIKITSEYNETVSSEITTYINKLSNFPKRKTTKNNLLTTILSFKSLVQNWDGYGALPLEIKSTSNSIQLLDLIGENIFCAVRDFYPNSNGTITFEWENSENEMVSLEVGNETFSYFVDMASIDTLFFNNKSINATEAKKLSEFIQAI